MRVEVVRTYLTPNECGGYNVTYTNDNYYSSANVSADNCTSIKFTNRGTVNCYIMGNITVRPNETIEFNNDPGCIIKQGFRVNE